MLGTFLQLPDAGKVAAVDSTLKSLPQSLEPLVTNFKEDPNTALQTLGQDALQFGLKVLAALAIYIIGAWLIKRIKVWMQKGMAKK